MAGNLDSIYSDPTLDAMNRAVEAKAAAEPKRNYLGASGLGGQCERALWYSIQPEVQAAPFDAETLYKFEDGHRVEAVVLDRLRAVPGVTVWDRDETTGGQIGWSDLDGRFRGHVDAVAIGLPQAPKTPHVVEVKACGEKTYQEFVNARHKFGGKAALQNWNYTYYCQAILYMFYLDIPRHYLIAASAGGRKMATCRTETVPAHAKALRDKAARILAAETPPARIMDDPSYWVCKFCRFKTVCHDL